MERHDDEPHPFTPTSAAVRGTHWYWSSGALCAMGLGLCYALRVLSPVFFSFHVMALVLVHMLALGVLRRMTRRVDSVSIQGDTLVVRRGSRADHHALAASREGRIEARGREFAALITARAGATIECRFEDVMQAEQFLAAAGLRGERNVVQWRLALRSPTPRMMIGMGAGLAGMQQCVALVKSHAHPLLVLGVFLTSVAAFVAGALSRPTRVRVGMDGLILVAPLGRRFISFREIRDVTHVFASDHVFLWLANGKKVQLGPSSDDESSQQQAAEFQRLVAERLRAARGAGDSDDVALMLERHRESFGDWRRRLRQLVHGGYRASAVPADAVNSVLDNATATPEQRIGAALMLLEARTPDGAERVRVAADRCAERKLRVALERLAHEGEQLDDQELEEVVRGLTVRNTDPNT